jgi:hypothetical protein
MINAHKEIFMIKLLNQDSFKLYSKGPDWLMKNFDHVVDPWAKHGQAWGAAAGFIYGGLCGGIKGGIFTALPLLSAAELVALAMPTNTVVAPTIIGVISAGAILGTGLGAYEGMKRGRASTQFQAAHPAQPHWVNHWHFFSKPRLLPPTNNAKNDRLSSLA